jgi:hypothetical protein
LIDIVPDLAASMSLPDDEVEKIRASKNEKIYQERLKVAAQVLPASLRPGGMNPLGILHDLLSLAPHSLSEHECSGIAAEIREVFDFVFTKLRAEVQDRRLFAENIQKVIDKRKKQ